MRIGITGAGGYLGSHVCAVLRGHGHSAIALSRGTGCVLGNPVPRDKLDGLDALVHCAYDFTARGWQEIVRVNVDGSIALLRAASAAQVKQVVFVSSMAAFSGCRSMYGRGKLLVEAEAMQAGATIVRPGLIFGGQVAGLFRSLISLVHRFPVVPLPGWGDQRLYLTHVEDLCCFIALILECCATGVSRPLVAANPSPIAFRDILRLVAGQSGLRRLFVPVPSHLLLGVLGATEFFGIRLLTRKDSLVSFLNRDPNPDFSVPEILKRVRFRSLMDSADGLAGQRPEMAA